MAVRPRPELEGLRPAVHGAIGDTELAGYGLRWDDVLGHSLYGTDQKLCILNKQSLFICARGDRDPTFPVTQYNGLCHVTL